MKIKSMLLLVLPAVLCLPAGAQSPDESSVGSARKKVHTHSRAMQSRLQARLKEMRDRAAAEAPGPLGPIVEREPVEFTIETKDCSLVKSQVKGIGFLKDTVYISMNPDGTFHVDDRAEGSGTAVDAAGNKYVWVYNFLGDIDTANPDPTAGAPADIVAPDTFQLIPATTAGTLLNYWAYFNVKGALSTVPIIPTVANGPIGCDPL